MPPNAKVEEIETQIVKDFSMTYDDLKKHHSAMLDQITSTASRSPAYATLKHITDITQLGELPTTPYDKIEALIEQLGVEKVLLKKPDTFWYTSGSTGKQKKIYYGKEDFEDIATGLTQMIYISGARITDSPWIVTSTGGDTLFGLVLEKCEVDGVISTLASEMEVVEALKRASKLKRIDLMVGVTWLYLLMHRVANNPKDFEKVIEKAVRDKVKVPGVSWLLAKYLTKDIDYANLAAMLSKTRIGFSNAEALAPYLKKIYEAYPCIEMHDVFGATEQWVQAVQISKDLDWLSYMLKYSIPELADPEEVLRAKQDPAYVPKAVPWYEWEKGMRGELLITRPGACLPLIRYPTGDMIEVKDPAYTFKVAMETATISVTAPAIFSLGRASDSVDFESDGQNGNFFGFKVYSRQINDAMFSVGNIHWWELYNVKGAPGRFVFLIIPEKTVNDEAAFRKEIMAALAKTFVEFEAVEIGRQFILDEARNGEAATHKHLIELMIARPEAYDVVDREIKERVRKGRSVGQQKPKRIIRVDGEDELKRLTAEKMAA